MAAASDPIAGPSRPYFPRPFRIDNYGQRSSTPRPAASLASSRSSTPARPLSRARSMSTFSSRSAYDEDEQRFRRKRADSVKRMVSVWDMLLDKYPALDLREDDVVDLCSGAIIEDRGHVRRMKEMGGLGEGPEEGLRRSASPSEEEEEDEEVDAVGSDEDELGFWDERSGLDPQTRQTRPEQPMSEQDMDDLDEFLQADAERQRSLRRDTAKRREVIEYEDEEDEDGHSEGDSGHESGQESGVSEAESASGEDGADSSDDELNLLGSPVLPVRKTPAPTLHLSEQSRFPSPIRQTSRVNPPDTSHATHYASFKAATAGPSKKTISHRSQSAASLSDLFASPPPQQHSPPATLHDLFSPPPPPKESAGARELESGGSSPRQRSIQLRADQSDFTHSPIESPGDDLPPPTRSLSSRKGKSRMAGERPSERPSTPSTPVPPAIPAEEFDPPSDTERYYQVIHRLNSATVRSCRVCRSSKDEVRRIRSVYCKGRTNGQYCVFAKELGEEVVAVRDRNSALKGRRRSMSRALTAALDSEGEEGRGSRVGTEAIASGSRGTSRAASVEKRPRGRPRRASAAHMLRPDPAAGGSVQSSPTSVLSELKARRAMKKASVRPDAISSDAIASPPAALGPELHADPPVPQTLHQAIQRGRTGTAESDLDSWMIQAIQNLPREMRGLTHEPLDLSSTPSRLRIGTPGEAGTVAEDNGRYSRSGSVARSPRVCPMCRQFGGSRAEGASQCRGRFWSRHCPLNRSGSVRPSATPAPEVLNAGGAHRELGGEMGVQGDSELVIPDIAIPRASTVKKRSRNITPISTSPDDDINDVFSGLDQPETSLATRLSLPPSSPPISDTNSSPFRPTASSPMPVQGLPTPSPTISAEPPKDTSPSQSTARRLPPTSPLARRILPLPRGSHYALHPTPPPSIHGTRTSSLSGDRLPFTRPKSILRSTPSASDRGTSSVPSSLKRARFSLQPDSPPTSDHFAFDQFSQIRQVEQNDSDAAEAYSSSSPWRYSRQSESGSSPFSRELSVRAADVGFELGPGHTGRVPRGLINALFPKFGSSSIASMDQETSGRHGLSPKADDWGQSSEGNANTSNNHGREVVTPSRLRAERPASVSNNSGLMLPPPVPIRRASTASTPGPATPSPSASLPIITPIARKIKSTIVFKTLKPPSSIPRASSVARSGIAHQTHDATTRDSQPRSRSRSVSIPSRSSILATPSHRLRSKTPFTPASAPPARYRKNPAERKLAQLARELGDEAGMEWGMDEDVDEDTARRGREGTVFMYLE